VALILEPAEKDGWIAQPVLSFGGKQVRSFQNDSDHRVVVEVETNEVPLPSTQVALLKELLLAPVSQPDIQLLGQLPDVFGKIIAGEEFALESFSVGYLKQRLAVRISGLWTVVDLATMIYFLLDYSQSTLVKVAYKAPSERFRLYEAAASEFVSSISFVD